jgi:hypothetical protein
MPRKKIPLPAWIPQACELMAKYDLSLRQAAGTTDSDRWRCRRNSLKHFEMGLREQ